MAAAWAHTRVEERRHVWVGFAATTILGHGAGGAAVLLAKTEAATSGGATAGCSGGGEQCWGDGGL